MAYTVVEQYLHYGVPVRSPEAITTGAQYNREPGWDLVRQYFAWYVPEADLQTYLAKIENIATDDFVLQGEPAVDPMHGLRNGFFFVRGTAIKRMTSQPTVDDHVHYPSDYKFYGVAVMEDDFASLDTAKWDLGTNTGNNVSVSGGVLICASTNTEYGWLATHDDYAGPLEGAFVEVDVRKHNVGGRIQFSPTKTLSSTTGFSSEANWYEIRLEGTLSDPKVRIYKRVASGAVTAVSSQLDVLGVYRLSFSVTGDNIRLTVENDITGQQGGPYPPEELYSGGWSLGAVNATDDHYVALCAEDTPANGETWYDNFALKR